VRESDSTILASSRNRPRDPVLSGISGCDSRRSDVFGTTERRCEGPIADQRSRLF
jgi:hypothetical protein